MGKPDEKPSAILLTNDILAGEAAREAGGGRRFAPASATSPPPGISVTPGRPEITTTSAVAADVKKATEAAASRSAPLSQPETATDTGSPMGGGPTSGSSGGSGSEKQKIPCPNCTGKQVSDKNGRPLQGIAGLLSRIGGAILFPIVIIWNYIRQFIPEQNSTILDNKCELCGGTQQFENPSDMAAAYQRVEKGLDASKSEFEENEAKLGIGENDHEFISGNKIIQVGLGGPPPTTSYVVKKDKGARVKSVVCKQKGVAQLGGKCNHVEGFPVIGSPGGHFVISCDNSFKCLTGPQGFNLTTKGPVTLEGGITRITGPEVTVGAGSGKLLLGGDTIVMEGRSVEVSPSDGDFVVKGKIGVTGNMVVKGKLHAESLSFVTATGVAKNESSNVSSALNMYGGPAKWSGWNIEGIEAVIDETQSFVTKSLSHHKISELIITPRWIQDMQDNILNLAYMLKGTESLVTGICLVAGVGVGVGVGVGGGVGVVINFPHVHALPDGMHCHETRVPDIDTQDKAELVRGLAESSGINSPAPVMTRRIGLFDMLEDLVAELLKLLTAVFKSPYDGK